MQAAGETSKCMDRIQWAARHVFNDKARGTARDKASSEARGRGAARAMPAIWPTARSKSSAMCAGPAPSRSGRGGEPVSRC